MKALKLLLALIAAVWAMALIPKLLLAISHSGAPFAFSYAMGSTVGILIAGALSLSLFRSAFRN
jgi:hypothetical protein